MAVTVSKGKTSCIVGVSSFDCVAFSSWHLMSAKICSVAVLL